MRVAVNVAAEGSSTLNTFICWFVAPFSLFPEKRPELPQCKYLIALPVLFVNVVDKSNTNAPSVTVDVVIVTSDD